MGNETSVPAPEQLAAQADELSGTSPRAAGAGAGTAAATAAAAGSSAEGGSSSVAAASSSLPQHASERGVGICSGAEHLGLSDGLHPPSTAALPETSAAAANAAAATSSSADKVRAAQQQMKARAAAIKSKGVLGAKHMLQRTGIGGGGGGSNVAATAAAAQQQQQYSGAGIGEASVKNGVGAAVAATGAGSAATASAPSVAATPPHPLHQQHPASAPDVYHHHPATLSPQQQQQQQYIHGRSTSSLLPGQGGKGALVDVMYATEHHQHHPKQQQQQQQQYHQHHQQQVQQQMYPQQQQYLQQQQQQQYHQQQQPYGPATDALNRKMEDLSLSNAAVLPPTATTASVGGGASDTNSAATTASTAQHVGAVHAGIGNAASTSMVGKPTAAQVAASHARDEREWQAAWEEDDESSGEEEDEIEGSRVTGAASAAGSAAAAGGQPPLTSAAAGAGVGVGVSGPPFRVSMDGGHSSTSLMASQQAKLHQQQQQQPYQHQQIGAAMGAVGPLPSSLQQQQQQQYQPGPVAPVDGAMKQPPATVAVVPDGPSNLLNGLVWDTQVTVGAVPIGAPSTITQTSTESMMEERPNEKMFLSMRVLGKGSFGKVVLVQKRSGKERGGLFAMKILRKQHLVKRRQIERTRTERKVLALVDHPFIMKLHFAFQSEDKLYLVLDYCPGGELFFHLSRYRRFPERVARFYAAELLLALGHLHKKGIIYRDLKPENVLLDADGHVKLGDFGLAKANIAHPCQGATSMCGTPEYMAPEVLAQAGHGFCVDYWGLGMLVYEMMTGLPPWYTTDRSKLFRRLKSAPLDVPTYFSMESTSCVRALLERNPRKRLGVFGIKSAMQHEFFREIDWRSLRDRRIDSPIRPCEGWKATQQAKENGGNNISTATGQPTNSNLSAKDLEVATANFDQTFTRMPVQTIDNGRVEDDGKASTGEGEVEELNEKTFVGFTFHESDGDGRERRREDAGRIRGGHLPSQHRHAHQQQEYGGARR